MTPGPASRVRTTIIRTSPLFYVLPDYARASDWPRNWQTAVILRNGLMKVGRLQLQVEPGFQSPPAGTSVVVRLAAGRVEAYTAAQFLGQQAEESSNFHTLLASIEDDKLRVKALAEKANASIRMPVRWTSAQKIDLARRDRLDPGHDEKYNTVTHILVLDELRDGRFYRPAKSLLCTSPQANNGKYWTGDFQVHGSSIEGQYVRKVTCVTCLRAAEKWAALEYPVDPVVVLE